MSLWILVLHQTSLCNVCKVFLSQVHVHMDISFSPHPVRCQVKSESLMCMFRASCCSTRLSWAQVPAFAYTVPVYRLVLYQTLSMHRLWYFCYRCICIWTLVFQHWINIWCVYVYVCVCVQTVSTPNISMSCPWELVLWKCLLCFYGD